MAPPLPRILSAVPQTLQVRLEIAKAVQTLALQREGQQRSIEGHLPECDAELIKECARELRREFLSFIKDRSRQRAAKAAVDDPKHPGWPAHTPGGKGGKFRPKDAVSVAAGESEAPPPGIGHNQGPSLGDPPQVPKAAPASAQARNAFLKAAARWLARAGVRSALRVGLRIGLEATIGGPVGDFLLAMEAAYWLHKFLPYIQAYLQPPKTLEELQRDALNPQPGYNIHHVVEQTPARQDGFPESKIEAQENKVRIPTLKHWQISAWYQTRNERFGGLSPRDYLKAKSWDEHMRIGKEALVLFGVLKP